MAGSLYLGSQRVCPTIVIGDEDYTTACYQVSDGVATRRSGQLTGKEFSNIVEITGDYALQNAFYDNPGITGQVRFDSLERVSGERSMYTSFYYCTGLTSVSFSSLIEITGGYALSNIFFGCSGITSADFGSLVTVGNHSLESAFSRCTSLASVDLSSLENVGTYGLTSAFSRCTSLASVDLSSLKNITSYSLSAMFSTCTGLENVYFNSLTTDSFNGYKSSFYNLLTGTGTSKIHTLHFPSNLEQTISDLTTYPLFGGSNGYVVLKFDLPATS